jgi:hypothetical protein
VVSWFEGPTGVCCLGLRGLQGCVVLISGAYRGVLSWFEGPTGVCCLDLRDLQGCVVLI